MDVRRVIFRLDRKMRFPPAQLADPSGLLAVGGDLRPERLLLAYRNGIFPWFSEGQPILWHCPDPRTVLSAKDLHIGRSLAKVLRRAPFQVRLDTEFRRVIESCARVPRPDQDGTWITPDMVDAYVVLHELGVAHSVEAWQGGELVGGLYGVSLGAVFFGESMFATVPDASKVAFVRLVRQLQRWGIELIDCQVETEHLKRFGAVPWSRARFLEALAQALDRPTHSGRWSFDGCSID
jgi:leucyl/phenylalanyl-tRNA--protein transferase